MEKLIVENFVSIRKVEIKLNKINILIGPQAAGKSLLAKLIAFIKDIHDITTDYISGDKNNNNSYESLLEFRFKRIFPVYTWEKKSFNIDYCNNKFSFKIYNKNAKLNFTFNDPKFSENVEEAIKQLNIDSNQNDFKGYIKRRSFSNFYAKRTLGLHSEKPLYIPAGRSFFSGLQKSIFKLSRDDINIDYFISKFANDYGMTKSCIELGISEPTNLPDRVEKITNELLKGKIEIDNDEEWIINKNSRIRSEHTSSGQQELIPMVSILTFWPFTTSQDGYTDFIIEEPEAHLFPVAQKGIISLISIAYNHAKEANFTITTHSPYIVSSINNLILASNIIKNNPSKRNKINEIIKDEEIVDFDDVSAYLINDGIAHDILDKKEKLINADFIDDISNTISKDFGKLLDIEFGD
ncbi:AAA family ATPase [Xenorhabdus bovienii]|uniref:AAA family ATPase n=1 Tax=Xenorhabdus bovienii TaxID=40576 RepID=UPI0023B23A15|nr:AAA family ATPase [Xenorhabdus bovienii]MDE9427392.1 ATP-binding protein [Xenorhabdus bovienii]